MDLKNFSFLFLKTMDIQFKMSTPDQQARNGKRSGKLRHIYGERTKPDKFFKELRSFTTGQSNHISTNDKFIAVTKCATDSPVYILQLNAPQTIAVNQLLLHASKL